MERIKATVMLCYGYVTFHSPPKYAQLLECVCVLGLLPSSNCSLITSRVEVNILRSINPHFAKVKVCTLFKVLMVHLVLLCKLRH